MSDHTRQQADLFPETLLVEVSGKDVYTTSLLVAEHFGKLHKDVLKAIERLHCTDEFRQINFKPSSYRYAAHRNLNGGAKVRRHSPRDGVLSARAVFDEAGESIPADIEECISGFATPLASRIHDVAELLGE